MSNCACSIEGYGDEYSWSKTRFHVAKKEHMCDECKGSILPGQKYMYIFGNFENEHYVHKVCPDCNSIIKAFFCGWCMGCVWDDLRTEFEENPDDIQWGLLNELTPNARKDVIDLIQYIWDIEDKRIKQ
jgi:hypothetical protein